VRACCSRAQTSKKGRRWIAIPVILMSASVAFAADKKKDKPTGEACRAACEKDLRAKALWEKLPYGTCGVVTRKSLKSHGFALDDLRDVVGHSKHNATCKFTMLQQQNGGSCDRADLSLKSLCVGWEQRGK
jgi:hypothetical protein